jgi:uncharacterized membrane protein
VETLQNVSGVFLLAWSVVAFITAVVLVAVELGRRKA